MKPRNSAYSRAIGILAVLIGALPVNYAAAQELDTSAQLLGQSSIVAGTNATYRFAVANTGGSQATNTELTVTLPAGVEHVADTGSCSYSSPIITCGLGSIQSGDSVSVNITLSVRDDFVKDTGAGFLNFSATSDSDESPPANTFVGNTAVTESADLQITNVAQQTHLLAGEMVWYTIYVDNYGPSTARDVVITDTLLSSDNVYIQSCAYSVSQGGGTITQFTCTTGPVVQTQFGTDIATFRTNFVRRLANVPDDPATPENEAAVQGRLRASFRILALDDLTLNTDARVVSLTPDPDVSNNQIFSEVVDYDGSSDLSLDIDSSGELQPNGSSVLPYDILSGTAFPDVGFNVSNIAVTAGRRVKYTYTIKNEGPSESNNVTLTSRLPAGVVVVPGSLSVSFGDGSAAPGNCQFGTPGIPSDEMTCGLGTIVPDGASPASPPAIPNVNNIRKIEFEVASNASLGSGTVLVNNVLLSSSVVDEDNSNNLGSSLMVVSPLTGVSNCSVGGPYTNVVCGNGSTILDLNGFGFALPDTGTLDFQWTSTCPGATFNDPTSSAPQLSFTTANPDNSPVSCQVELEVQNAFASSNCSGIVNVVDCQADCFGLLDGPAKLDRCGVCDGDGQSCLGCSTVDTSSELLTLTSGALSLRKATFKVARQLSDDRAARLARRQAKSDFNANMAAITKIPAQILSCTNTNFCSQTLNVASTDAVGSGLQAAADRLTKLVKQLRKESGDKTFGKKFLKQGSAVLSAGQSALVKVPLTTSSCS